MNNNGPTGLEHLLSRGMENSALKSIAQLQRGSALIECSIVCSVMIPVVVLLATLANISEVRHHTILASRYLAWEQTVNATVSESSDIERRFYNPINTNIRIGGRGDNSYLTASSVSFGAGAGQYLQNLRAVRGFVSGTEKNIHKLGTALEPLSAVDWDINPDGLVNAGVQVNIVQPDSLVSAGYACNGGRVEGLFGCVSSHNAILVDGWGAGSNLQAERRTRALVPAAALSKTGNSLAHMGKFPFLNELGGLHNAFGKVDSSILPLDRYSGNYQKADSP